MKRHHLINASTVRPRSARRTRRAPDIPALAYGGCALVALLGGLASYPQLGLAGWIASVGYAAVLLALLCWTTATHQHSFGPADWVTLARAVLAGGILSLTADRFVELAEEPRNQSATVFAVWLGLTILALSLDAVDGPVGRRTATTSRFGARFDMEVDAFLILVLSVALAISVGFWALAIGGMRYVFVLMTWLFPRLAAPLPASVFRKSVAASQGILLVLATGATQLTTIPALSITPTAVALALLSVSFARDIGWLVRHGYAAESPRRQGCRRGLCPRHRQCSQPSGPA